MNDAIVGVCTRCNKEHTEKTLLCLECKLQAGRHRASRSARIKIASLELGMKLCARCAKPHSESTASCEPCKEHCRRWLRDNRPRVHARLKADRQRIREVERKRLYGLEPGEYDRMLRVQKGVCAICSLPPKESKLLGVDHCHTTGKVRELLCDLCNRAIGYIRESSVIAEKMASYIRKHAGVST